jgi:hypothetical protein
MARGPIFTLKATLVVFFAGLLAAQVWFFPVLSGNIAEHVPELAGLRWPMLTVVILVILAAEVAVIAVWKLLTLVQADRVFSGAAYAWVNLIAVAAAIDTVLVLGVNVYLGFWVRANPPILMLFLLALTVAGAGLVLLVIVMKGLLRQAAAFKGELDEVI